MWQLDPLLQLIDRRSDARPVGAVRILAGLAIFVQGLETMVALDTVLAPHVVPMPYLAWLPRLPHALIMPFIVAWLVGALAFALGFATRVTGTALLLLVSYALFVDQQTYSNHLYLICLLLLLLLLANPGARFSLDSRRSGGQPSVPAWPVALLKLMVSVVYCYAALGKLNPDFLSGAVLRSFLAPGMLDLLAGWRPDLLLRAMAIMTVIVELFLAVGLWLPRLRLLALLVGIGFHLVLVFTGGATLGVPDASLAVFATMIVAPYLLFFPWPERLAQRRRLTQRS